MSFQIFRLLCGFRDAALVVTASSAIAFVSPPSAHGADAPGLSLSGEVVPTNGKGARLAANARAIRLDPTGGDPGRILAKPGERFDLRLQLANARSDAPLRVSAGMGGVIEADGRKGPFSRSRLGSPELNLAFIVGDTRGRYVLEIANGSDFTMLEFWVGEEPPQGKPGPARSFRAPANLR